MTPIRKSHDRAMDRLQGMIPHGSLEEAFNANGALFKLPAAHAPPRWGRLQLEEPDPSGPDLTNPIDVGRAIAEHLRQDQATLKETYRYRLWAAYRLTVEAARHLRHYAHLDSLNAPSLGNEQFLFEVDAQKTLSKDRAWSPWDLPRWRIVGEDRNGFDPAKLMGFGAGTAIYAPLITHEIKPILKMALALPDDQSPWVVAKKDGQRIVQFRQGLTLRPPRVPRASHLHHGYNIDPDYNPYNDKQLMIFMATMQALGNHLQIHAGTASEPYAGQRAYLHLFSPMLVRLTWPTPTELIEYEDAILQNLRTTFVRKGEQWAEKYCRDLLGYTRWESRRMINLVQGLVAQRANEPISVSKGLAVERLEDLARRAAESMDMRTELMAIKTQAVVQGISRAEIEDEATTFRNVAKALPPVSREKEQMPQLPSEIEGV